MLNSDSNVKDCLKSLTLLCVEDNLTTQFLYKKIFYGVFKAIIFAGDGKEGYEQYLNNDIDIIISDYLMPNLNGIEMIEKIREFDTNIPIILVSSIEDLDVIVRALKLNVNNFIKKPIIAGEVMKAVENSSKLLIANKYLEEQKNKQLNELKEKDSYHLYQENLAFSKELNILKNDFYYKMIDIESTLLIDFFYSPLDIVSGDAYSVRKINDEITIYIIIDGMGKGLSASLSSMLMTSFTNHIIDMMIEEKNFNLFNLINSVLKYIRPILLDEETVSADFIVQNHKKDRLKYSKFAMPSALLQTNDNEIKKLKSNNQPISKYIQDFNISTCDTSNITKFLFYSDGLIENKTMYENKLYAEFIENDFYSSYTKKDFKNKLLQVLDTQEDDITFIFLNKLSLQSYIIDEKIFESRFDILDIANDWYSDVISNICSDSKIIYSASIVFTELFMNAYEHGSLGLDSNDKNELLRNDTYFETLKKKEKGCNKKITVSLYKVLYNSDTYIISQIADEGCGFDTNILSKIFRNTNSLNGRGVFVSRESSSGIYYNSIGNVVLFLHKIES